ncbi:MAG: type II secretion system protein [Gemmatimonadetes bacterium]|nr:type II secretion system protein [Gemmatimonadota bacterium]
MNAHARPAGTTLVELLVVIGLLGILAASSIPSVARWLDAYTVRAARDALLAGLARARASAVARGHATFVIEVDRARFWAESDGDTVAAPVDLAADYGVRLETEGAPLERLELAFDALGLGRMAARTLHLRRGRAEAGIAISSYGRARPW